MLVATATIAHAREVHNSSNSWVSAEAWFEDGTYVSFSVAQNWGPEMYFNRGTHQEPVDCGNGQFGFVDTWVEGWGPADSFTYASRYAGASASGSVDVFGGSYDSCTNTSTQVGETHTVDLDWTGEGPIGRQSGTWSDRLPSWYNAHSRCSGSYRNQSVTGTIDGQAVSGGGRLGETTCTDHHNSR
jgi:hypothetical protein